MADVFQQSVFLIIKMFISVQNSNDLCWLVPDIFYFKKHETFFIDPIYLTEAMQVVWTLSFDIAAKTVLKENQEAMELFDKLVSAVPKHRCRKAAKGILWNLRDAEKYHPSEGKRNIYQWIVCTRSLQSDRARYRAYSPNQSKWSTHDSTSVHR
jgi:hypothetical protein